MRRIVSRSLWVLGGAIAGTVVTWALSGAAASAGTELPSPVDQVGPVVQPMAEVLSAAEPSDFPRYAETFVGTVLPEPPASPKLDEIGRQVHDAVGQVTGQLKFAPRHDRPMVPDASKLRWISFGDHDVPPFERPLETLPQPAVSAVTGHGDILTGHAPGRHLPVDVTRRGPPSDGAPALPLLPAPMPPAPPTVPAGACSACGHHGSDDDAGMPVSHTWPNPKSGLATSRALRMITQHVATATGAQPGVTPD
jgi:hypothetical protein